MAALAATGCSLAVPTGAGALSLGSVAAVPSNLTGTAVPGFGPGPWRTFVTAQHGDNVTYELIGR